MDTRTKIISGAEASDLLARQENLFVVRADLDPLHAPHIAALEALGKPLLVVLGPKESEYLNLRARSEMAASLGCVQYVIAEENAIPIHLDLRPQETVWRNELETTVLTKAAIPEKGAS